MINTLLAALQRYWTSVPSNIRRNFSLDLGASILVGVYVAVIINFVPVVARRLGANPFLLSLITAAPAAGNIIAVLTTHYMQGHRKMPIMVTAWCAARGLFLLSPLIIAPLPFALIVVLHWVILSLPIPGYVEIMRQVYPDQYRGRAMAYVRVGFTACITLITPLAGWLLDVWGYRFLFPIASVFGILTALTFGQMRVEEAITHARHDLLEPWRVLFRDARYRDYNAAFFIYGFGSLMTAPLIPLMLVDELHLNYSQVGLLGMVNSVFWMLFYIVWGRTVDRQGGLWTMRINFILSLVIPLAFFGAQDMWLAALAYAFTGITVAGVDLGWINAIMQFAPRDRISDYTALHSGLVGLRGIAAPLTGTALMAVPWIGLRGTFVLSAILILAGWLFVRRVQMPNPKIPS